MSFIFNADYNESYVEGDYSYFYSENSNINKNTEIHYSNESNSIYRISRTNFGEVDLNWDKEDQVGMATAPELLGMVICGVGLLSNLFTFVLMIVLKDHKKSKSNLWV